MDAFIKIVTKKFEQINSIDEYYLLKDISEDQIRTLDRAYYQNLYCSNTGCAEYVLYNTMYKFSTNFKVEITDLKHPQWDNIVKVDEDLSKSCEKNFIYHYLEIE